MHGVCTNCTILITRLMVLLTVILCVVDTYPHIRSAHGTHNRQRRCEPPDDDQLQRLAGRFKRSRRLRRQVHDSFGQLINCTIYNGTRAQLPRQYVRLQYISIDEDRDCPTAVTRNVPLDMCPKYFVIEYDPNRVPFTMAQARCRCTECFGPVRGRCEQMYYYTRVLRVVRCNSNGIYEYGEVWEPVSVGCTCVPRVTDFSFPFNKTFPVMEDK